MANEEKRIEFHIKTDGTFTIEAFGFEGNSCEQATAPYEEALGGETVEKKRKPEFFKVNATNQSTKVNGG